MTHTDIIKDADAFFEIDPITRVITNKTPDKTKVMQYDHNSERFTFSMPQFVEGHDMANCNRVEVHYININTNTKEETRGLYEVKDVQMHPEDAERIVFSWLLSQNVTRDAGVVHFIIRFSCVDAEGVIDYAWSTEVFKSISVAQGIYNADVIVELYADVLEQWKTQLFDASAEGVENIYTAKTAAIAEVEATGEKVKASIPDDYVEMTEKLKNVTNALKGTASGEAIGLNDVSPIEHTVAVKVKSKNVISIADKTISGDKGFASGTINIIPLTPNTVYTVSADFAQTGSKATVGITVRDSSGTTIGRSDTTTDTNGRLSATFTVPTDGKIAIVLFSNIDATAITGTSCSYSNFQIEEGTTSTAYAPYVADVSVAKVNKYGDNLFNVAETLERTSAGLKTSIAEDGGIVISGVATDTVRYMAMGGGFKNPILLLPGTYTVSGHVLLACVLTFLDGTGVWRKGTFTLEKPAYFKNIVFSGLTVGTEYNMTVYPCLSVGDNAEYEPYKEPTTYTPNADGTVEGVTSLYPSTTLLTDIDGVVIDCEYNRDINKAFEELTQAIVSLGGNV
jgi:hypothetical protein